MYLIVKQAAHTKKAAFKNGVLLLLKSLPYINISECCFLTEAEIA